MTNLTEKLDRMSEIEKARTQGVPWHHITGDILGGARDTAHIGTILGGSYLFANADFVVMSSRTQRALIEVARAAMIDKGHNDTCQMLLITDREIPLPCNCGTTARREALIRLAEVELP